MIVTTVEVHCVISTLGVKPRWLLPKGKGQVPKAGALRASALVRGNNIRRIVAFAESYLD